MSKRYGIFWAFIVLVCAAFVVGKLIQNEQKNVLKPTTLTREMNAKYLVHSSQSPSETSKNQGNRNSGKPESTMDSVQNFLRLQEFRENKANVAQVELYLREQGYEVQSQEISIGKTGARTVTLFSGGNESLVSGRIDWSGFDANTMNVEHLFLAYANANVNFERYVSELNLSLKGWTESVFFANKMQKKFVQNNKKNMILLTQFDSVTKHDYEALPAEITILISHEVIE